MSAWRSEGEGGRWALALTASLALHVGAAVLTASFHREPVPSPRREMTVTLRVLRPPAPLGPTAPPAEQGGGAPALDAKPAPVPEAKPAPPAKAKPKPKPKAQAKARPATQAQIVPAVAQPAANPPAAGPAPNVGGRPASRPGPAVGGGTTPQAAPSSGGVVDLSSLKVSRRVKPAYPALARKRGEEGTTVLLVTLDGPRVVSVNIERSSGSAALDKAAQDAVSRWRFENAGRLRVRAPVTFRLK